MLYEGFMIGLTLFGAFGLLCLGWLMFAQCPGKLRTSFVVIPVSGDAAGLEETVAGYLRSSRIGLVRCHVLIADQGLSPLGRAVALMLISQEERVILCPHQQMVEYIQ